MINQYLIYMVSEAGDFIEERTESLKESLRLAELNNLTILEILDTSYNPYLAPF